MFSEDRLGSETAETWWNREEITHGNESRTYIRTKDLDDKPRFTLSRLFEDRRRSFGTSLQRDKGEFSTAVQ